MRGSKLISALIITNLLLIGAMLFLLRNEMARARGELTQTTPHLVSYQGMLTDSNGNPINGTKDLTITVYNSGTAGVPLWQELHKSVPVDAGAFAVLLGENTSLLDDLFDNPDRWMEIEVDGVKLSPRQRFTSVPYALNADKLDGYDANELEGGDALPSGAVVWFRDGAAPTGYTRIDTLGLDVGSWEPLADRPEAFETGWPRCFAWTGSEALCWFSAALGARYDVASDSWTAIATTGAPTPTAGYFSGVWTGSEVIIWGGYGSSGRLNTGGRYNPSTDSWTPVTTTNAPVSRTQHSAVWTGSEMIIWGGDDSSGYLNTGGRYNPSTDSWTPVTTTNAPVSRTRHSAIWTGSKMIIWGGNFADVPGGLYDPSTDNWAAVSTEGQPSRSGGRTDFYASLWTGSEMVVVPYGYRGYLYFYNPATNTWRRTIYRLSEGHQVGDAFRPQRPPIVAGHLLITHDGIYDLSRDKWVALAHELVDEVWGTLKVNPGAERVLWTGDTVLFFGGEHYLSHAVDIIYPYAKD
jgi:hypothetical protein